MHYNYELWAVSYEYAYAYAICKQPTRYPHSGSETASVRSAARVAWQLASAFTMRAHYGCIFKATADCAIKVKYMCFMSIH